MTHWTWDPANREYHYAAGVLFESGETRAVRYFLRECGRDGVVFVNLETGVIPLTFDQLDEAAAIARRYRDTGVFGEGGGA